MRFEHIMASLNFGLKPLVPFKKDVDKICVLDLSAHNSALTKDIFCNTSIFEQYIQHQMGDARYGIGGYLENRAVYTRSTVFDGAASTTEPRSLHLGIDIWGAADTPVMAPLAGTVHSKGYHPEYGNYGATLLLTHSINDFTFYTLYGHLSATDLAIEPGTPVEAGQAFAHFGSPHENGQWPPHLHFQVIIDLQDYKGDYPGVCAPSQKDYFAYNCPDPAQLLTW